MNDIVQLLIQVFFLIFWMNYQISLQNHAEINYETLKNAVVGGHLETGAKMFCQPDNASDAQSRWILSNPIDWNCSCLFLFLVIRSLQSFFFSSREACWKLAPWTYLWRGSDGPWNSPEVYFQLFANDSCPPAKICCFSVSHKKEHHKFWIKTGYWKRWFKLLFQRWYNQSNPGSTWMWTNYGW